MLGGMFELAACAPPPREARTSSSARDRRRFPPSAPVGDQMVSVPPQCHILRRDVAPAVPSALPACLVTDAILRKLLLATDCVPRCGLASYFGAVLWAVRPGWSQVSAKSPASLLCLSKPSEIATQRRYGEQTGLQTPARLSPVSWACTLYRHVPFGLQRFGPAQFVKLSVRCKSLPMI